MSTTLPGPRGRFWNTCQFVARPIELMTRCAATHGGVYCLPTLNGDVVVAGTSEAVRTVFTAPPETFVPFNVEAVADLMGTGSLVLLGGERHRRERKLLMPSFHGDRMRAYARGMAEVAARRFGEAASSPRSVAAEVTQKISLDVILRAVFGVREVERTGRFADAVVAMTEALHPALPFMRFLHHDFGGIGPYARLRRRMDALEGLFREQIARARAEPGEDILSLMVAARYDDGSAMSERDILDELKTLLFAGHETTALSLAWALDLLHRHPSVLFRVREELDGLGAEPEPGRYAALPSLEAVCKEVLRVRPVVTEVPRRLAAPLVVGGYELSPGIGVAPSMLLVHHDPELYPEPYAFRPERFLERKYTPFEYLPFGGGNRRCIGAAFAMFEMQVVLGVALSRYQFQLLDARPPRSVRRSFTMGPSGGVPLSVRARPRQRAAA
jgi:cytochrome P450 family 110